MVTRGCGAPARAVRCGAGRMSCAGAAPLSASRFCLLALIAAKQVSVLERGEKARALSCDIMSWGSYQAGIIAIPCPGRRCGSPSRGQLVTLLLTDGFRARIFPREWAKKLFSVRGLVCWDRIFFFLQEKKKFGNESLTFIQAASLDYILRPIFLPSVETVVCWSQAPVKNNGLNQTRWFLRR